MNGWKITLEILGGNADAAVSHGQHRVVAALFQRHRDRATWLGELRRVLDQVTDDLAQASRIPVDVQRGGRENERQHVAPLVDEWLDRLNRVPHDCPEIDTFGAKLDHAATDARQVHKLVHKSQKHLRLCIDRLDQFEVLRTGVAFSQQVDVRG